MLPKHHYDFNDNQTFNDSDWISGQIDQLPISVQKKVAQKYSDIYLQLSTDKDRKVRFRANTWLRAIVDKYKVAQSNDGSYF